MTFKTLQNHLVAGANGSLLNTRPAQEEDMTSHYLVSTHRDNDYVGLGFSNGGILLLYHPQESNEVVELQNISAPLHSLLLSPLTSFATRYEDGVSLDREKPPHTSQQFTYHDITTPKGKTTLTWYGCSNNAGWEQAVCDAYLPEHPLSAHERTALIADAARYHNMDLEHA